MTSVTIVGTQWGDEGKGKIVDWLSGEADIVVEILYARGLRKPGMCASLTLIFMKF